MTNNPARKPTARELVAARQRRQKDLPLEPAGKKPVGKELKVVGKEPAPAVVADNRDYKARYLDEVSPELIIGRRVKFKDGIYVTADDEQELPKDAVYAVLVGMTMVGWVRFFGPNVKPLQIMGPLYHGYEMPPRESLGELDQAQWEVRDGRRIDPFQHHQYLVLQDAKTAALYTFDTATVTGRGAVGAFLRHYDRTVASHPDNVPLIRLGVGGFQHKDSRIGWVVKPQFIPIGWRPAGSTAAPDVSTAGVIDDEIDLD